MRIHNITKQKHSIALQNPSFSSLSHILSVFILSLAHCVPFRNIRGQPFLARTDELLMTPTFFVVIFNNKKSGMSVCGATVNFWALRNLYNKKHNKWYLFTWNNKQGVPIVLGTRWTGDLLKFSVVFCFRYEPWRINVFKTFSDRQFVRVTSPRNMKAFASIGILSVGRE